MKRFVFVAVVLAAAAGLGWMVYQKVKETKEEPPPPQRTAVAVEAAPVSRASISHVGRFTGSLEAESRFVVAPKVGGRLKTLLVHIGDRVESGQLLATLDDEEFRQQVEQAQAELKMAEANVADCASALDAARREYERAVALHEKKIASESGLDEAQARYRATEAKHKMALAQVDQKKAALNAAELRLSYTKIGAAWEEDRVSLASSAAGERVVGERYVDEGELLRANDPIVSVLNISQLKAVVHVTEIAYANIEPGQKVSITTDAWPGRSFSGTIMRVAPLLREKSRQAQVEISVPNAEGVLKPGMFVRAEVVFDHQPEAIVVPVASLCRRNGNRGVFLVDEFEQGIRARFVTVTVGIIDGALAQIVHPPDGFEAEKVVTMGQHLLQDGDAIMLPEIELPQDTENASESEGAAAESKAVDPARQAHVEQPDAEGQPVNATGGGQ